MNYSLIFENSVKYSSTRSQDQVFHKHFKYMLRSLLSLYQLNTDHNALDEDVIKWKHCPRDWPFVRGIHRSHVNSPHKGQWRGTLMFFFYLRPNKQWSKLSRGWSFETPSRSLWRHCNGNRFHIFNYEKIITIHVIYWHSHVWNLLQLAWKYNDI